MDGSKTDHQQREGPAQVLVENIAKHVCIGNRTGTLAREKCGLAHHNTNRAEQGEDRTNTHKRNDSPTIVVVIVNEGQEERDPSCNECSEIHECSGDAADDFPKPIAT